MKDKGPKGVNSGQISIFIHLYRDLHIYHSCNQNVGAGTLMHRRRVSLKGKNHDTFKSQT